MIIKNIRSKKIKSELRFNGGYFLNEDALNASILEDNYSKCTPLKKTSSGI